MKNRCRIATWITCVAVAVIFFQHSQLADAAALSVGVFKIEILGLTKMGKPNVVAVIKKVLIRYDIILIEDIRDASQTAIYDLLKQVNRMGFGTWEIVLSTRLGRTSSKEQYAFFYKPCLVSVVSTYQYPDPNDVFEREPFVVRFKPVSIYDVGEFGFLAIHVKPTDAVSEIDKLVDVYDTVSSLWDLEDILIGGNFNAGCTYVKATDWDNIRLKQDTRFLWTILDSADTNVATTVCAYDRIVLAGSRLRDKVLECASKVHYFDVAQNITHELTELTSDHYPVEVSLT